MPNKLSAWLSLFASTGTIFCCALPSLFVALGMGATMAGFIGVFPQVIWLSQHKILIFAVSGVLIALSAWLQYAARNAPCPVDPKLAAACRTTRRNSLLVLSGAFVLWVVGAFFAFVAPVIFN